MIHKIAHLVYRNIRQYGGLSRDDVAKAIGRRRQVVWRWEEKGQMPSREHEEILVEAAKLTPLSFVEIMCKVLSLFLEEARVVIAPGVHHMPRASLIRATELYRANYTKLDPDQRASIEARLSQGRILDSVVEQTCTMFEKQISDEIEAAIEAKLDGAAGAPGEEQDPAPTSNSAAEER